MAHEISSEVNRNRRAASRATCSPSERFDSRRHDVERRGLRRSVVVEEVSHQARGLLAHRLRQVRLRADQVGQRQLQRIADRNAQPGLAILGEAKAHRVRALADRAVARDLKIGLEDVQRVRAEPRLGKTDPTVFPDAAGVVEKGFQFQQGAARRFATGAAAGDVAEEARLANAQGQIAIAGPAHHHGLQFVFAAGGGVGSAEGELIERNMLAVSQAQRFRYFSANRSHRDLVRPCSAFHGSYATSVLLRVNAEVNAT